MIKKIKFKNKEYWLTDSSYCEGLISPLDHFNENGEMLCDPFTATSYAIIEDGGKIMRFGNQIGRIEDIEDVGS
jgi:hypothetical protein